MRVSRLTTYLVRLWQLGAGKKLAVILLIGLPWGMGMFVFYATARNVMHRIRPRYQSIGTVSYSRLPDEFDSKLFERIVSQTQAISDSLTAATPYSIATPLPPFELRVHILPQKEQVALLYHCRLWCSCDDRLTDETFQLIIYQLSLFRQGPVKVLDTIMTWTDYARPFSLKPNRKEVIE